MVTLHGSILRSALLAPLVAIVTLATTAAPTHADGNGAVSYTQTFKDQTTSFPVGPPCVPDGMLYETYNMVFHVTINNAGDVWATGTMEGSFTFVPSDKTLPTYTGHATDWFGESDNRQNAVMHSTFNAQAHAPDGSHLDMHETFHYSVSATGVTVAFDNVSC